MCLFNNFLIDILQERLISTDVTIKRTAFQYLEQMLDIFTCSDLILCIFHFLTGLPIKTKEEAEMDNFDDEIDISSYRSSRLSMSIEGHMF